MTRFYAEDDCEVAYDGVCWHGLPPRDICAYLCPRCGAFRRGAKWAGAGALCATGHSEIRMDFVDPARFVGVPDGEGLSIVWG